MWCNWRHICYFYLISPSFCHMTSLYLVIIGSGNGLSPAQCQAIEYIDQWWLIFNWALRKNSREIFQSKYTHIQPKNYIWKHNLQNGNKFVGPHYVKLLWLSDAIWQQRFGSILVQVLACYLTAPCHYLNQCWLSSMSSCGIRLRVIS